VEPPPPVPPPAIQAKCAMDTTVAASYEEQRLPNKLSSSDALSFSQQLLQASGFDKFGPDFAVKLCSNGLAGASSYDDTVTLLRAEGQKLWQAALDRVQGRVVQGTLSKSDDRMLYWARLTMTLALRQWKPDFPLTDDQRAALQNEFERASRPVRDRFPGRAEVQAHSGQRLRSVHAGHTGCRWQPQHPHWQPFGRDHPVAGRHDRGPGRRQHSGHPHLHPAGQLRSLHPGHAGGHAGAVVQARCQACRCFRQHEPGQL
jgi:hypothetical protein